MRGLIPQDLINWFIALKCDFSFISQCILPIVHSIQGSLYNDVWLVRCERLVKKELTLNITNKVKRGGKYLVNSLNLVFPLIRYNNFSRNLHVANSWVLWCDHSCRYGNSWLDF